MDSTFLPPYLTDLAGHLGPHAMRYSFATLYLDAGGSLRDLQNALGHADPRTTRRYDRPAGPLTGPRATWSPRTRPARLCRPGEALAG